MNAIPPTISDHLAAVFELRGNLWNASFRPVPVYGPQALVPNPGKRPKGEAWQTLARQTPPFAVEKSPELDACNTGILSDALRPIDIDIDDPDIVAKIIALANSIFGEAPIRFRAKSPRCLLLFRATEGSPKKLVAVGTLGKVEILGHGQQFLAFGTHPSGASLEWKPKAPGEIHLEELVPVTEEQVANFLKEVGPLIGAETQEIASSEPHLASALGPTAALEDVEAALEVIPNDGPANWEYWNDKIGLATWHATMGRPQGYKAWLNWSAKHPSFNKIECQERWANYGKSPPNKIGAGTLFHLAKQASPGWCKPSSIPAPGSQKFGVPNMGVLTESNHPPPTLPISAFGNFWGPWIKAAAECANVPPDYVAVPLLATASAFMGNARWARAWDGWQEPPVLWCGCVGEPSSGKTHGASMVMNFVSGIETSIGADYENEWLAWKEKATIAKQHEKLWKKMVDVALMEGNTPPQKPKSAITPERPIRPRLSVTDTTIEQLATILSGLPKGLLVRRDELSGWFLNFSRYSNGSDRPFWLEANGGRSYQVDRVRTEEPTLIRHLSLAVFGTIQPDRLAETLTGADDGLISRFLWTWPESKCFVMPGKGSPQEDAMAALLRLKELDLITGTTGQKQPHPVPLVHEARLRLESFCQHIQEREKSEFGLMKSTLGKARGQALRLALVLEYLWWSTQPEAATEPAGISGEAMSMAINLMDDYFLPMAARVFGDAAVPQECRNAQTLLRWILKTHPKRINVSQVRDNAKLPGLRVSKDIKAACQFLVEADCLVDPQPTGLPGRPRGDYIVNPQLWAPPPAKQE